MNDDRVNCNEILLSGIIYKIYENDKQIKFILKTFKYTSDGKGVVNASLCTSKKLYDIYKDYFVLGNKVYVKGYIDSYIDKNNVTRTYITVTDISKSYPEILKGSSGLHIRYDPDGMMVWNGKRCESRIATPEEQEEMRRMIAEVL